MFEKGRLRAKVQVLEAEAAAVGSRSERTTRNCELMIQFLLRGMDVVIDGLPLGKRIDARLGDCNFSRTITPKRHESGLIRVARLSDAAVVRYTTQEFLVDAAHTLVIPTSERHNPTLNTKFINVDSQMAEGPDLDLVGYTEFAINDMVVRALHYGAGALAVEARTGWQHAVTNPSRLGIRQQATA